jgi:recombination associated protein RdgC
MFKNVIIYRIQTLGIHFNNLEEALASSAFEPCAPSQEKSIGWTPPRGNKHGPMLESVGDNWIAKLMIETRSVPSSAIAKKAAERCAQIEISTGRKPGKKETREIKDDIKLELLPLAFSKESSVLAWIDPNAMLLAIDASGQSRADEVVTMLVKSIEGLALCMIDTKTSPVAAMSEWLITQDAPDRFSVERECELRATDESKATIKYGNHPLDIDEVKANVESGKLPTRLAMTWNDRVSFVLTDNLHIKKVEFLDALFDAGDYENGFDADVAISTYSLRELIPDLIFALGGEQSKA